MLKRAVANAMTACRLRTCAARRHFTVVVALLAIATIGGARAAPGTSELAALAPGDWAAHGHDMGGGQYSPLADINVRNVSGLKRVWTHELPDRGPTGVTPLFVNGTIYYCSQLGKAVAVDPATGKELWRADPYAVEVQADGTVRSISGEGGKQAGCRAVTYWAAAAPKPGVPCEKRIFWGDANSQGYAVDADTGKFCLDFGASQGHSGYVSNFDFENHGEGLGKMVSPGAVVGDTLVTTQAVADRLGTQAADGYVRAWDVRSGRLRWEFDPIPPQERDRAGAANVWSTISADPLLGLVYIPTTALSPDYYGGARLFDDSLADALIALDVATGRIVWSHTLVRHDIWDYDLPGHALLSTITHRGRKRTVAIQQTKMGFVFVFDRATGTPVFPIREMKVPPSRIPGERAARTQPRTDIQSFSRQEFTRAEIFGLTPEDRASCQQDYDRRRHGFYEPPGIEGTILLPSNGGGGDIGGAAFDPESNLLIVRSMNVAMIARLIPKDKPESKPPGVPYTGVPYDSESQAGFWLSPLGAPCTPPPWVTLTAIDMNTGRHVWQRPWGQAQRFGGKPYANASLDWGATNVVGGPIVTGGGLVFMAGTDDLQFQALDIHTGKELWRDGLSAPATTVPITFKSGGRQYVVVSAAGRGMTPGAKPSLVAYALDP
jgi:quinoprotein glucose dehydrogenase